MKTVKLIFQKYVYTNKIISITILIIYQLSEKIEINGLPFLLI